MYENCGRPTAFDERDCRRIRQLAVKSPRSNASDILRDMGASGDVSVSTMKRTLAKMGCKAMRPGRRPFINTRQMQIRLQWAKDHEHWTVDQWKEVVFSDETVIELVDNAPRYVRVVDGHELTPEHYVKTTKHPSRVMIWACFSWYGTGRCHVVEGTMGGIVYADSIIDHRVVQQMHDWPHVIWFQQDNAPPHTSRVAKERFAQRHIRLLPWPPASPDANPIEHLWAIVKRRLKLSGCTRKQDLVTAFLDIWVRDAEIAQICKNLVASMPERVEAIIRAKGGATRF